MNTALVKSNINVLKVFLQMKIMDIEGKWEKFSEADMNSILVIGWIFFLMANIFNIIFYSVHPAEVQFQKKKTALLHVLGYKVDLLKCFSLRHKPTKYTINGNTIPLTEMASFHQKLVEIGDGSNEKMRTMNGNNKQSIWSIFPIIFKSHEIPAEEVMDHNAKVPNESLPEAHGENIQEIKNNNWNLFPFFNSEINQNNCVEISIPLNVELVPSVPRLELNENEDSTDDQENERNNIWRLFPFFKSQISQ